MKKLLFALAAMPFVTGIASGAERLSDAQMVQITAGALPDIICPSCLSASSMSTSTNGVTQTMSTSGSTGTGSTGSGSTGTGSTGTGSTGTGSTGRLGRQRLDRQQFEWRHRQTSIDGRLVFDLHLEHFRRRGFYPHAPLTVPNHHAREKLSSMLAREPLSAMLLPTANLPPIWRRLRGAAHMLRPYFVARGSAWSS